MAYDLAVAIGVGLAVWGFVWAYLATNIDKKHFYLQFFFLVMTLLTFGIDITVLSQAAKDDSATNIEAILLGAGLNMFIWMLYIVIFIIIIYFVWQVFQAMRNKNDNEDDEWGD